MAGTKPAGLAAMRRTGIAFAGVLAVGMAVLSGTAFASSNASSAHMTGMTMSGAKGSHVGTTKGWLNGHTVTFKYTKNFICKRPPASKARTGCEAGADYTQTPAAAFDPLYVVVPLGFTPKTSTLQCPHAGRCIDHPSTIDLSAVLGKGTGKFPLPPHSHIIATGNGGQSEWWNVIVVGVTSKGAWHKIVTAKSHAELMRLQRTPHSGVTGNIVSNLFLYFKAWG